MVAWPGGRNRRQRSFGKSVRELRQGHRSPEQFRPRSVRAGKRETMMTPILVTGAAGRVGAVGRTIAELLLSQDKAVRAMVRTEDERAQALRALGAEVVVGDLLDLDSMHSAIAGCETMYFGLSVSDAYLAAKVSSHAGGKHSTVNALS